MSSKCEPAIWSHDTGHIGIHVYMEEWTYLWLYCDQNQIFPRRWVTIFSYPWCRLCGALLIFIYCNRLIVFDNSFEEKVISEGNYCTVFQMRIWLNQPYRLYGSPLLFQRLVKIRQVCEKWLVVCEIWNQETQFLMH